MRMYTVILMVTLGTGMMRQGSSVAQEYAEGRRFQLIRSTYSGALIAGMNIDEWLNQINMADYHLDVGKAVLQYDLTRKYTVSNLLSGDAYRSFRIWVGIHPTVREAEDAILSLLDYYVNAPFEEMPAPPAGDAAWFVKSKHGWYDYYVFVRRNAVVFINDTSYGKIDILSLAKGIDEAFMNGGPFVTISDTLRPPVVHSVSLTPTAAADHELVRMIISAEDPEGYSLWYRADQARFGPAEGDPENVLKFYLNPSLFSEGPHYGEHKLQVFVVNENNLFSSIKEVPITF